MGEVTRKQAEAYERRSKGEKWDDIAKSLGISEAAARTRARKAVANGRPPLFEDIPPGRKGGSPHHKAAGLPAAEGMFEGTQFDMGTFVELAASAGIPPRLAAALGRRVQGQFANARREIKAMTVKEQVEATHEKALLVLQHIDEVSVGQASAKDLAIAYGILVDKGLVLGGKPTQIFDVNVRASLQVLMPQFLAEAKRRGITIEGEFHVEQPTPSIPALGAGSLDGEKSGAGDQ